MDMDVHTGSNGTDYSDYEIQRVQAQSQVDDPTGKEASTRAHFRAGPLEGRGGLANNEVAELVGFRLCVKTAYEADTDDQDNDSGVIIFGSFGINLQGTAEFLNPSEGGSIEEFQSKNNGGTSHFANSEVDDRVLDYFQHTSHTGFVNGVQGAGGGGTVEPGYEREVHFREVTGRGPVLDSTDDITLTYDLEGENVSNRVLGRIDVELIWDVAEVSDAGRAFSVPDGV